MSGLKRLIHEIHRRSLWQVLAIYVAAAWLVLQVVEVLVGAYGLPPWFPGLAAALLLIGLPVVLATAVVQAAEPMPSISDPTLLPDAQVDQVEDKAPAAKPRTRVRRQVLTLRNAIMVAVGAFALWGVIAAGWAIIGFPGLVVRAEAADFFNEHDRVVVAEFGNMTDQPALGLAIRTAIVTDLDQSEYVEVVDPGEFRETLERMRLPDTADVDTDIAVEAARRLGYPAVVAGEVTPLGRGYQLSAQIIEAASGDVAVRLLETATDEDEVIPAVERLARLTRRHLGESLQSIRRSPPLPLVTTASLQALEFYARGLERGNSGEHEAAISWLQQAVELDTAFAAAYRGLGIYHGNIADPANAQANIDRAHRYAERLPAFERYMVGAAYHSYRGRFDSVAYYYELALEIEPDNSVAVNNLGDNYERMGRYEEALRLYGRAAQLSESATYYLNWASAARTLGLHELADSALEVMRERYPQSLLTAWTEVGNAYYAGDYATVEAAARAMMDSGTGAAPMLGRWALANHQALHGRTAAALAHADTAAEMARGSRRPFWEYSAFRVAAMASLAAGTPDRIRPLIEKSSDPTLLAAAPRFHQLALGEHAMGRYMTGDMPGAQRYLELADSLGEAEDFQPYPASEAVRAMMALDEGQPEASLAHIEQARDAKFGIVGPLGRLLLADTYANLGRLELAAAHYDSLTRTYRLNFEDIGAHAPLAPLAHERLGNVYLVLGDTTAALRHFTTFVELWRDADPELRPRVESAQRLVERLAAEGR